MKVYENLSLENLEGEIWKDVVGYEGYQVSNLGRIKSLDKRVNISGFLKYPTTKIRKGKILRQSKDKDGYLKVALFKDREKKYLRVHRIVAMTFIPNPENKKTVDHKNTIVDDNRVENLQWFTHRQQLFDNEITKEHWSKNRIKATNSLKKKVRCITTGEEFECINDAVRKYNIADKCIIGCCKGKQQYTKTKTEPKQKLQWEYIK
jgi:hypothetical protein